MCAYVRACDAVVCKRLHAEVEAWLKQNCRLLRIVGQDSEAFSTWTFNIFIYEAPTHVGCSVFTHAVFLVQFIPPTPSPSLSLDIFPGQNELRCACVVRSVLLKSWALIPAKEFQCLLSDECL